jgi:hypothetical protein
MGFFPERFPIQTIGTQKARKRSFTLLKHGASTFAEATADRSSYAKASAGLPSCVTASAGRPTELLCQWVRVAQTRDLRSGTCDLWLPTLRRTFITPGRCA